MKKHSLILAIFDRADTLVDAIHELRHTDCSDDQLGFVVRYDTDEHGSNSLASEFVNGLLGSTHLLTLPSVKANAAGPSQVALKSILHLVSPQQTVSPQVQQPHSHIQIPPSVERNIAVEYPEVITTSDKERSNTSTPSTNNIIVNSIIGGTLGAIATLVLPGIGPIVAGGLLTTIVGSSLPKSTHDIFLNIGVPACEIHFYEQQFKACSIVFMVKTNEQIQEVHDVLHSYRANTIAIF